MLFFCMFDSLCIRAGIHKTTGHNLYYDKFFLTSCQVPSIRTGHNLYYVKKSVPFTWNSWTSLVARNLNKNCSLIQPPTFDPK